jgi:hypothetical protein
MTYISLILQIKLKDTSQKLLTFSGKNFILRILQNLIQMLKKNQKKNLQSISLICAHYNLLYYQKKGLNW